MSEPAAQNTISIVQIDGRIAELEAQRNGALSRAARIAGERDEALDLVRILKAEVGRLTAMLADRNGLSPAVAAGGPESPHAPSGAAEIAH